MKFLGSVSTVHPGQRQTDISFDPLQPGLPPRLALATCTSPMVSFLSVADHFPILVHIGFHPTRHLPEFIPLVFRTRGFGPWFPLLNGINVPGVLFDLSAGGLYVTSGYVLFNPQEAEMEPGRDAQRPLPAGQVWSFKYTQHKKRTQWWDDTVPLPGGKTYTFPKMVYHVQWSHSRSGDE